MLCLSVAFLSTGVVLVCGGDIEGVIAVRCVRFGTFDTHPGSRGGW